MSRVEQIGDATKAVAIYALCEYPSWMPRYVGKTTQYVHERHKAHIRAAKRGARLPVHYWIRKKIAAGERLAVRVLEHVQGDLWAKREAEWIARFQADGFPLLNLTAGGEGLAGHTFTREHRDKIAARLRTGAHFSCLVCGTEFWRKASAVARGHNKFCCRKCANQYNKGGHRVSA